MKTITVIFFLLIAGAWGDFDNNQGPGQMSYWRSLDWNMTWNQILESEGDYFRQFPQHRISRVAKVSCNGERLVDRLCLENSEQVYFLPNDGDVTFVRFSFHDGQLYNIDVMYRIKKDFNYRSRVDALLEDYNRIFGPGKTNTPRSITWESEETEVTWEENLLQFTSRNVLILAAEKQLKQNGYTSAER